jgi:mannose-6-phosphate isomerase-like protein (cupin superfamily)
MKFDKENFDLHTQRLNAKPMDWSTFNKQGQYKSEYARAHIRMVGGSITGKHDEPGVIPAEGFTLSLMMMPPGSVAPSHAHECEEVFFCLQGTLIAWWEDETGKRLETVLNANDMLHSPSGVLHGIRNETLGDALVQVIIGKGRPLKPIYADENLSNLG